MTYPQPCELYCSPSNDAMWHQVGWWPDVYACASCKEQWIERCLDNPKCLELSSWHVITTSCLTPEGRG